MKSTVRDVMTEPAIAVSDTTPFKAIVSILSRHGVSAVPVVDRDRRVVGVVSEADLIVKEEGPTGGWERVTHRRRSRMERRRMSGVVAAELMTTPAVTIGPQATIAEAARVLAKRGLKRLPVVDEGGRLLGIVSRRDVLAVFLRPDDEIRDEIVHRVIQRVLMMDPFEIPVTVRDGVVTLEGRVEHRSMLPMLAELVGAVEGVVGLDVRTSFEVDDTRAWRQAPYLWPLAPFEA